ncbi:MAG TPA: universal stress protein [Pseudolabrys sp.]|nr:universal stress protein [Pseudolabrys sp.]
MYKHILIPTDGSELSKKALQHGAALAKAVGADLTVLTVSAPYQAFVVEPSAVMDSLDQYREITSSLSGKVLEAARQIVSKEGVTCKVLHVEHEHPYQAIIDTAKNNGCDLIAMASHGRHGVSAILLGSETAKVLIHCTVPVLVYR